MVCLGDGRRCSLLRLGLGGTAAGFMGGLLGIGGGLFLGALLGFVGLRLTKFETTDAGHFYTPSTPIGVVLSLLFLGRMLYRFWVIRNVATAPAGPPPFQSPLTFFIFGLIAGYYLVFYIGLFVHTHDKK